MTDEQRFFVERTAQWGLVVRDREQPQTHYGTQAEGEPAKTRYRIIAAHIIDERTALFIADALAEDAESRC